MLKEVVGSRRGCGKGRGVQGERSPARVFHGGLEVAEESPHWVVGHGGPTQDEETE